MMGEEREGAGGALEAAIEDLRMMAGVTGWGTPETTARLVRLMRECLTVEHRPVSRPFVLSQAGVIILVEGVEWEAQEPTLLEELLHWWLDRRKAPVPSSVAVLTGGGVRAFRRDDRREELAVSDAALYWRLPRSLFMACADDAEVRAESGFPQCLVSARYQLILRDDSRACEERPLTRWERLGLL